MKHLHAFLNLEKNGIVQIVMDNPAYVYLLAEKDYTQYLAGTVLQGGLVKSGTKKLKAPSAGQWHLVIDNRNQAESVNVTLQVVNGTTISQQWAETSLPDKEPVQTLKAPPSLTSVELEAKKKELVKELSKMIKQIDMEGLLYLLKQASVIIHNQQVEQVNSKIVDYNQTLQKQKKMQPGESDTSKVLVDLKENTGNSFILVLNGVRKVLSRYELAEILRICDLAIDDAHFGVRIYTWLKDKRRDILFDAGIKTSSHALLLALRVFLLKRFKSKKA